MRDSVGKSILKSSCNLVDIIEEVVQMSRELNVSFHHIKRSANQVADKLGGKEGVLKTASNVSM